MNWTNIQNKFNYSVLNEGDLREITSTRITRTGLEFNGYVFHKNFKAIILWGKEEFLFLNQFTLEKKIKIISFIFNLLPPLVILSRSFQPESWFIEVAKKYKITILSSNISSSEINTLINMFLAENLGVVQTIHGNLLELYGKGVLVLGESGIGKSETTMELIKKGHIFIADDAVDCINVFQKIIGRANTISKDFMEVRGLGIINVPRLFGIEKIKKETEISVIIEIIDSKDGATDFERLGRDISYKNLLNVEIPYFLIPLARGRKTSDLIEVIVANLKLTDSGYNSFKEFTNRDRK